MQEEEAIREREEISIDGTGDRRPFLGDGRAININVFVFFSPSERQKY